MALNLPGPVASNEERFIETIERIRGEWFPIMLTIGFNKHFMESEFARCHSNFDPPPDKPLLVFHEIFRCGNTAYFLWYLFTNGNIPVPGLSMRRSASRRRNTDNRKLLDDWDKYNRDDLNIYLIRLGGTLPDHTLVVAQINDKYYIMQSFVSTYTFSSKHAFARIVYPGHFEDMLRGFLYFCDIEYNPDTMDLAYSFQTMYKDAEEKLTIYTNIDMHELSENNSDRHTDMDFAQMLIMKHTIPAAEVAGQLKLIYTHICKGIEQAPKSPSQTLASPSTIYTVYISNRLLGESRITIEDLQDTPKFKAKLSAAIGFNGHDFNSSMIHLIYGQELQVKLDERDRTRIRSLVVQFKLDVNVEKLVNEGLVKAFKCLETSE